MKTKQGSTAAGASLEGLESRTYFAAGTLDPFFGNGGKVLPASNADYAQAVATLPDGRFVVAGRTNGAVAYGMGVARYNADGSLDATFGQGGRVVLTTDGPSSVAGVAVQADGKIVVAGAASLDFVVFRLNANGTPDTTFDADGRTQTDFAGQTDNPYALVLRPDGRIVVGGYTFAGGETGVDFAVAQYRTDGSLDPSFGTGGKAILAASRGRDEIGSMAVQADGKLLVAGTTGRGPNWAVARITTGGRFDMTFGLGGVAEIGLAGGASDVVAMDDGSALVGGSGLGALTALRLKANGRVDQTFGQGGVARVDFGYRDEGVSQVLIQKGGKVVLVGNVGELDADPAKARVAFALARLNADGGIDRTFGRNGRSSLAFDPRFEQPTAAALASRGRVLVVASNQGWPEARPIDFRVTRFTADGPLDASFGADGTVRTNFTSPALGAAVAMVPLADGRSLVLSSFEDAERKRIAVTRYTDFGGIDTSFGDQGTAYIDFGGRSSSPGGLAVSADGRIAVVGATIDEATGVSLPAVALLDSNGVSVTSFGAAGRATYPLGTDVQAAMNAVTFSGDKLLVAGGIYGGAFLLMRLNPDGELDPTFGSAGLVRTRFAPEGGPLRYATAYDLAVQGDGRIVLAGVDGQPSDFGIPPQNVFAVARYTSDGQLDASFGDGGRVTVPIGAQRINDVARALAIQGDGRIVIAGTSATTPNSVEQPAGVMAVVRLRSDGTLDPSFGGGDGKATVDFGPYLDSANAVLVQSDGRILLAGQTQTNAPEPGAPNVDFAMARLGADGSLDATFGTGGKVTTDLGAGDSIADAALLTDGRILVAGSSGPQVALARYENDDPGIRAEIVGDTLVITGTPGDDVIRLGRGGDGAQLTLEGRGERFNFGYDFSKIVIRGLGGNDVLDASALAYGDGFLSGPVHAPVTLEGGDGRDTLVGGPGDENLLGGAGDDSLDGRAGNDTLFGGDGDDTLRGGDGDDYLNGGPAADLVFGDAGNDQVFAVDAAHDTIDGGLGFDRAKGDADDLLTRIDGVLG